MEKKYFLKGNSAAAEAGIRTGCKGYFFYPVTPSSEIGEYMSLNLPEHGGVFVQAESEIAAVNMLMGGASSGARVMTGTSGVGFSLMTEGISYMAGAEVPAVIIDVMRGGPGLGTLEPTQSDYNQLTKAPGHGGHIIPVFAPGSVQEIVDSVFRSYDVAFKYRTPVGILYDAYTGQMMESVVFPESNAGVDVTDWALDNAPGRKSRVVRSGYGVNIMPHWEELYAKYDRMKAELQEWEEHDTNDAVIILCGFGLVGRICRSVAQKARAKGIPTGVIRPKLISPFPEQAFERFRKGRQYILTAEMSYGQMINDVTVALGDGKRSRFFRNRYGSLPRMAEILGAVEKLWEEIK